MPDPDLNAYTIGWIAAIRTELVAAQLFLDEVYKEPIHVRPQDSNTYTLGRIGQHNIVMACLPHSDYGQTSATTVATHMLHSFPNVRVSLMVGIAGGATTAKNDVRLGDIVVSSKGGGHGGVFQYDYGKTIQGDDFQFTQSLNQPPAVLLTAVNKLAVQFETDGHELDLKVSELLEKKPRLRKNYSRPPATSDRLYKSDFVHSPTSDRSCCDEDDHSTAPAHLVTRPERGEYDDNPAIHYGLIASANQLMKDALVRDALAAEKGVLCFEMESAGLMNNLPCLVIRGICDYSDSHKNKEWQGYAAMVAAAYAREIIRLVHPSTVEAEKRIVETLSQMEKKFEVLFQATTDVKKVVDGVKSEQHIRRMEDWLQPPLPWKNAHAARQNRQEGTGTWLLDHSTFKAWKSGSGRHLWLHGQPGCGKTVLSTTILDHLTADTGRAVISFFFDFSDSKKQTVDGMLRSLAFQLYDSGTAHLSALDDSFKALGNGRQQPTTDTLKDVVAKMLAQHKVSIILDALDESLECEDLIRWLGDVISNPDLKDVQFICTSRPEEYFRKMIPSIIGESNCIRLNKQDIDVDIALFVSAHLGERHRFQRLPPELVELIQRKIGGGAYGMFRWAACQLDSLEECSTFNQVRDALQTLPKDLDETYRKILDRISPARKSGAIRLLQFLVHSSRPPSVKEAIDIIATNTDVEPACFDIGDRPFSDDVHMYGLGLVTISLFNYRNGMKRKEVRLAHFSVNEFLVQQHDCQLPQASIAITKMCLAYLNTVTGSYREIERNHPLASSAAKVWTKFGAMAETDEAVFRAFMRLWDDEEAFQLWGRLYRPDNPFVVFPAEEGIVTWNLHDDNLKELEGSRLYYASFCGLVRVAEKLIGRGVDVNARGGRLGHALIAASRRGHGDVVELLLRNKAEINARGGEAGSALQAAVDKGHHEIVELLLAMGADVHTPYFERRGKGDGSSLLIHTLSRGEGRTADILLKGGADIHSQGTYWEKALYAAAHGNLVDKMEWIIRKGADVNAAGGEYGNALQVASLKGHTEAVKLLLREKANVNAEEGRLGNALLAASIGGHLELVALLLNKGAAVNAQGGSWGNALMAAAGHGYVEIVKVLVENGADINAQNAGFGGALQAALWIGHTKVVEYLLKRGADVNARGGTDGSALQAAATKGDIDCVELLLEYGAGQDPAGDSQFEGTLKAVIRSRGEDSRLVRLLYARLLPGLVY